ncbi:MAG: Ig-like domain-containing protein, partial [Sphingomonadaceae bacterium]
MFRFDALGKVSAIIQNGAGGTAIIIARLVAALAMALTGAVLATPAIAGPFTCSGDVYQVQSGQLRIYDPITSDYVNVGTNNGSYNATGYNILDNYAYGMLGNWVIRIHSDGHFDQLYNIGEGSYAGDVDDSNNLWIRRNNSTYVRIDLATGVKTPVTFTGSFAGGADVVWIKDSGGTPYLLTVASNSTIGLLNLNTNVSVVKSIASPGLPSSTYGAIWTDSTGRIFTFNNSNGNFYELKNVFGASPTATFVGTGTPNGSNDGFSCSGGPFPNLPPVAQDDAFTAPYQTAITRNLLVDNGSGVDFDPEGLPLVVATTPVSGPSHGTVSITAAGLMTYTPAAGFYGTDTFTYRVTDAAGLTDTATVTITIPAPPIDIAVTKDDGLTEIGSGLDTTYTLTITNNHPSASVTGAILSDPAVTGLNKTSIACSSTPGVCTSPPTIAQLQGGSFSLPTIGAGQTYQILVTANVTAASGSVTNGTTIALPSGITDPTPGNNSASDTDIILGADLVTVKTLASSDATPLEGDIVRFQIAVTNNGPGIATGVSLTDLLPSGMTATVNNGVVSQGSYNAGSGLWSIGTRANGATATISLEGTVDPGTYGSTITNITTAAAADQPDGSTTGDDLSESVEVVGTPGLSIAKAMTNNADEDGSGSITLNDTLSYSVTATNSGTVTQHNVVVSDNKISPSSTTCATLAPGATCVLSG